MDGLRRRNSQEAAIGIAQRMLRTIGRGSFIALLFIGMLAGHPGDHQALTSLMGAKIEFGCTIQRGDCLQCTEWRCSAPPEEPPGASS